MADTITFTELGLTGTGPVKQTGAKLFTVGALAQSDVTNLTTDLANKQPLNTNLTNLAALGSATFGGNLAFANSFTTSGSFSVTQTYTGATNVTFPTTGTLATTTDLGSYLPLAGGPLTGAVTISYSGSPTVTPLTLTNTLTPGGPTVPEVAIAAYAKNILGGLINIGNISFEMIVTNAGSEKGQVTINAYAGTQVTLGETTVAIAGALSVSQIATTQSNLQVPPTSRTISAGGRLTGGGSLASDRTLTQNAYDLYNQPLTENTTARTLGITDACSIINCSTDNANDCTITIPTNASAAIPIGSFFELYNRSTSKLLTVNRSGVTSNLTSDPVVGAGGRIFVKKIGTDTWNFTEVYELYSHTTTFTWGGSTSASQTVTVERRDSFVKMGLPTFAVVSAQNAQVMMTTALPARFYPSATRVDINSFQAPTGTVTNARFALSTIGALTIQSPTAGNFNTASYTMDAVTLDYQL
jgi:hypothetical protein